MTNATLIRAGKTAKKQITKFGGPISLSETSGDWRERSVSGDYKTIGLKVKDKRSHEDNTFYQVFLLYSDFKPTDNMSLEQADIVYSIEHVETVAPDGNGIIYRVFCKL